MSSSVEILNRRLGEGLGFVGGGTKPRFAWLWAPAQLWMVYDRDDRTLVRKSWADMPGPDGNPIGRAWVMGEWRVNTAQDHHGFGDGVRVAVTREVGYSPYLETALLLGKVPTDDLTANYIRVIGGQIEKAASDELMAEEKYTMDRNLERDRMANLERSRHIYDNNVGGFGNCEPGLKDGFLSWGGVGDSPLVARIQEAIGG